MTEQNTVSDNNSQGATMATNQATGPSTAAGNATSPPVKPKQVKTSQAEELLALANNEFSFFHSPHQEGFAKSIIKDCKMVMPLRSDQFKEAVGLKIQSSSSQSSEPAKS